MNRVDPERAAQIMDFRQIDVPNVVGGIIVIDLTSGPVVGLDAELIAGFEHFDDGNVGMPTVMGLDFLFFWPFIHFRFENCFCHGESSLLAFGPASLPVPFFQTALPILGWVTQQTTVVSLFFCF